MSELIYEKFGKILSNDVVQKLVGAHEDFKITQHHSLPSKNILIGALLPKSLESDISIGNSKDLNSISVKCLLTDEISPIDIDISFSVFYRVLPSFEQQLKGIKEQGNKNVYPMERVWKRKDFSINNLVINPSNSDYVELDLTDLINEIKKDPNVVKEDKRIPAESIVSKEKFEEFLNKQREHKFDFKYAWNMYIKPKVKSFSQDDEEYHLLELFLVNNTIDLSRDDVVFNLYDRTVFNPVMKINLNDNNLVPFHYVYNYDDQLKEYYSNLRCLNCHGKYDKKENSIKTSNYVTFDQEKISPKSDVDYADISFETLSSERGFLELDKIYIKMKEFYEKAAANSSDDSVYLKQLKEFDEMKERFNDNINLLRDDSNAAKAFYLMNETFKDNSKYPTWRLFQIVFIVLQIKDIVKTNYQRDICELLHVMTGGGKSEAYFGIVIFTAFWDRLTGKEFGVSALTKFPLRMLSIQQLQRIANVFIHAEKVRKRNDVGGQPFSIAYFVGSQGNEFPPYNFEIINQILTKREKNEFIKGKIIEKCPLCGGEVFLDIDETQNLIIHKCHGCDEIFRLYYSDDEIYRTLPTFIISTVDKLAAIATNRRFKNLLGGKLDVCRRGHGFIPHKDRCKVKFGPRQSCNEKGNEFEVNFDIGPTLIIQDEMHLIREGFGTIDSHFESLIEMMKSEFSNGVNFKNIVMTATVTGAKTQIKHLYHKETRIFPPTLELSDGDNFFFEKLEEDGKIINQRQIVGLKQNAYSNMLLLVILRYISEFIKKVECDLATFSSENDFEEEVLSKNIIPYYKNLLTYHNRKQDVHKMSYNISDLVNSYESTYDLVSNNLTGDDDLDSIKETINNVISFQGKKENKKKLSLVSATNIVSHGVDVDTWNVMAFEGMPRNTSEYIQALSRVGRRHFGIVFVLYDYMKIRDVSFYQNFTEYHEILNDKVETVPLSRWTKLGLKQTFTSVFCAAVLNYMSNLLEKPIYTVDEFNKVFVDDMNRRLLINFIKKAYISDSDMLGADFFDETIENETIDRINCLADYTGSETFFPNALKDRSNNKYYKTQFGMRGIQDSIILSLVNEDVEFRKNIGGN